MPTRERWQMRCDCGWLGEVSASSAGRVKAGQEVEIELDALFVGHLKPDERRLYVLVDQRQKGHRVERGNGEVESIMAGVGNFLMPEGTPCLLTTWHEAEGVYFGHYLDPKTGDHGVLPIGEVRTADGRVLRLDAPA